jgi:hypothetical protein
MARPALGQSNAKKQEAVFVSFAPNIGVHPLCRSCQTREAPWSGHSHSIVSGKYKHQKDNDFVAGHSNFTVICTVKKFRLGAIDAETIELLAAMRRNMVRFTVGLSESDRLLVHHSARKLTSSLSSRR